MSDVGGRPPCVPTAEQRTMVAALVACGVRQEMICTRIINPQTGLPITRQTLRKAFSNELKNGVEDANAMVAASLFKKATGDGKQSVAAAIFWLKTRARWVDSVRLEHTGVPDAPPIKTESTTTVQLEAGEAYLAMINGPPEQPPPPAPAPPAAPAEAPQG